MPSATTQGVLVSVQCRYEPSHSNPKADQYLFSYRVTIENQREDTVQLLARRWHITNGFAHTEVVQGPGVIGKMPVLAPGESHTYDSFCPLDTPIGTMQGKYLMQVYNEAKRFMVEIPLFKMEMPGLMN